MKLTALVLSSAALAGAAVAAPTLVPLPAPEYSQAPTYAAPTYAAPISEYVAPVPPPGYIGTPIPTYGIHQVQHNRVPIRYKDLKRIHPCAEPMTVCVDTVCGPVLVDICVPPHCCEPEIKHKRNKIVYDFGDYEVDIHDRKDHLVVDYDN